MVDLESCPYLRAFPSAEFEYATVASIDRETKDCIAVGYEGIDVVGYKIGTTLMVRRSLVLYECGICGSYHRWSFDGDCREDAERINSPEEFAAQIGVPSIMVEVRSMEDRVATDKGGE